MTQGSHETCPQQPKAHSAGDSIRICPHKANGPHYIRGLHRSWPGHHQLQAHSEQLTFAGSQKGSATMQATKASNSCGRMARRYPCWLTQEPSTNACHTGKRPLLAHSKQRICTGSHRSSAPMYAAKASHTCERTDLRLLPQVLGPKASQSAPQRQSTTGSI